MASTTSAERLVVMAAAWVDLALRPAGRVMLPACPELGLFRRCGKVAA